MVFTLPNGQTFKQQYGTRAQVMNGTAYQRPSGLTKKAFKYNRHGRIVARSRSNKKMLTRLTDAGYAPFKKGAPGVVRRVTTRVTKRKR